MKPSGLMAALLPPRILKITTFSLLLLLSVARQSMRRRNNRHDQHRAKQRDLELRKIFSAGCAS